MKTITSALAATTLVAALMIALAGTTALTTSVEASPKFPKGGVSGMTMGSGR